MANMDEAFISFKWNNHKSTFFHVLSTLRNKESYSDATLACEGMFFPVHKLVLSTCSNYFTEVFERTSCKSPVIILKDIRHEDLEALLDYMYFGEVEIKERQLTHVLKAAECLQIRGLAASDDQIFSTPAKGTLDSSGNDSTEYENEAADTDTSALYTPETHKANESPGSSSEKETEKPHCDSTSLSNIFDAVISQSMSESDDSESPAKRPKIEHEQPLPALLQELNKPTNLVKSPTGSIEPCQKVLTLFPSLSQNFTSKPVSQIKNTGVTKVSPLIPKPQNSQRRKIQVHSPRSAKLAQTIKIFKKSRNVTTRAMKKATNEKDTPTSASSHNHKNYYVKHMEQSENPQMVKENIKRNTSEIMSRRNPTLIPKAAIAGPSLLLSANIASLQANKEPLITPEDFCERIGLPQFSEDVKPILEGHELIKNVKQKLTTKVVDQLVTHLKENNMFTYMCKRKMRSEFYILMQMMIMKKYPKISIAESNRKTNRKGPLAAFTCKVVDRMNFQMRKLNVSPKPRRPATKPKKPKAPEPTPESPTTQEASTSGVGSTNHHEEQTDTKEEEDEKSPLKAEEAQQEKMVTEEEEKKAEEQPEEGDKQITDNGEVEKEQEAESELLN